MAFNAIEQIDSGVTSYSEGKPTVTRKYICFDDADGQLSRGALYNYLKFGILNCIGSAVPPNCIDGLGVVDPTIGLPLRSFDIQPVAGRKDTFEVTATYSSGSVDEDQDEGNPGFQEFSMSVGRTYVDGWRGSPNYPSSGVPSSDDIEGDPLDSQGEPVSMPILTQELSMGLLMNGAVLTGNLAYWRTTANTRNSNTYLGAAPGTLLFPGATVDRVGSDLYRASIVLYWDEYMHCRQSPLREADGSPKVSDKTADEVYWRQPFPVLAAFDFGVGLP